MSCGDCKNYLSSEEANKPRSGLAGYGYCQAADGIEARARFFAETTHRCWLPVNQFKERRK